MANRKRNLQNFLKKLYYDVKEPASYAAPATFYRAVKEKSKDKITRKQVNDWLNSQDTYNLHRRTRKKIHRNRIIVVGIDIRWQTDVLDTQKIC